MGIVYYMYPGHSVGTKLTFADMGTYMWKKAMCEFTGKHTLRAQKLIQTISNEQQR